MLRARHDAQAAGAAGIGARRVRRFHAVRSNLEAREEPELAVVVVRDATHLEDIVRTDRDAVALALAARAVDERRELAGRRFAVLARSPGVARGSPRLFGVSTTGHVQPNEQTYSAIPLSTRIVKPLFPGTSKLEPAA